MIVNITVLGRDDANVWKEPPNRREKTVHRLLPGCIRNGLAFDEWFGLWYLFGVPDVLEIRQLSVMDKKGDTKLISRVVDIRLPAELRTVILNLDTNLAHLPS